MSKLDEGRSFSGFCFCLALIGKFTVPILKILHGNGYFTRRLVANMHGKN